MSCCNYCKTVGDTPRTNRKNVLITIKQTFPLEI